MNGEDTMAVILRGGPADLPASSRTQTVSAATDRIKVRHGNGYEHFTRRTADDREQTHVVFHWYMHTAVAE